MNEGTVNLAITDRQREVVRLRLAHKTHDEIARALDISPKTVAVHLTGARNKLGFDTVKAMLRSLTPDPAP